MSMILGFGINDANYAVTQRINGKTVYCPYYLRWHNMLRRCFVPDDRSYENTKVAEEWLVFSNFKSWMELQKWKGNELDKDILLPGANIYSPDSCCFVPRYLNTFLNYQKYKGGKYPLGVKYINPSEDMINALKKPYVSSISTKGKLNYLGVYHTTHEAHKAWQWAKAEQIEVAVAWFATLGCFRADVAEALMVRVWKIRLDHMNSIETRGC